MQNMGVDIAPKLVDGPTRLGRHRPKLPEVARNLPHSPEIGRHRPEVPRHRPKPAEVTRKCPKATPDKPAAPKLGRDPTIVPGLRSHIQLHTGTADFPGIWRPTLLGRLASGRPYDRPRSGGPMQGCIWELLPFRGSGVLHISISVDTSRMEGTPVYGRHSSLVAPLSSNTEREAPVPPLDLLRAPKRLMC